MATSVPNLDSLFQFLITRRKKLKEAFGGSRYITMDKADLSDLVSMGLVIDFSGFYLVKLSYVWLVP